MLVLFLEGRFIFSRIWSVIKRRDVTSSHSWLITLVLFLEEKFSFSRIWCVVNRKAVTSSISKLIVTDERFLLSKLSPLWVVILIHILAWLIRLSSSFGLGISDRLQLAKRELTLLVISRPLRIISLWIKKVRQMIVKFYISKSSCFS